MQIVNENNSGMPMKGHISQALDNLVLCNRIREFASFNKPVALADLRWRAYLFKGLVYFCQRTRRSRLVLIRRFAAQFVVEPFILITLRLLLFPTAEKRTFRQAFKSMIDTLKFVAHRVYFYEKICSPISCFIDHKCGSIKLEQKNCLLLFAMGRYGEATVALVNAYKMGCDIPFTAQWLSYYLREIGDHRAADEFDLLNSSEIQKTDSDASILRTETQFPFSVKVHHYGIIIPSVADSAVFRSSLISLLESDFLGKVIVVEDGLNSSRDCEAFCVQLSVEYLKLTAHGGTSECFNVGIKQLDKSIDIVVLAHNDVLWPKTWFSSLSNVWNEVSDLDSVGLINLGYLQFSSNETLKELFVRRNYEYLTWILEKLMKVSYMPNAVQDVQVSDTSSTFGLTHDPWNTDFDTCRIMAGRWSVAVSMPKEIWSDMGGAAANVFLADIEVQRYCMKQRKLMLWMNNSPLIHCRSSDTSNLTQEDSAKYRKMEMETYEYFRVKYGMEIEHFLSVLFSDTYVTHWDEIVKAANERRFSDLDFIFDYFQGKLYS